MAGHPLRQGTRGRAPLQGAGVCGRERPGFRGQVLRKGRFRLTWLCGLRSETGIRGLPLPERLAQHRRQDREETGDGLDPRWSLCRWLGLTGLLQRSQLRPGAKRHHHGEPQLPPEHVRLHGLLIGARRRKLQDGALQRSVGPGYGAQVGTRKHRRFRWRP